MDRATVIVAIPPVGDRILKISSEKVAHLTLLYLGNVDLSADAILYVQHACSDLSPFGLSVDHRGTLGEDEADVLFFEDNAWDLRRVSEFRHYLLLNDEIKRAYEAADQFPEWTPHLTLGYPEAPAQDNDEDDHHRLRYVEFNRIAVWTDDFEGPEFQLKYETRLEVSMSDMTTAERGEAAVAELFHFGVKGMKWGVRKTEATLDRENLPPSPFKVGQKINDLPHQSVTQTDIRTHNEARDKVGDGAALSKSALKSLTEGPPRLLAYAPKVDKVITGDDINYSTKTKGYDPLVGNPRGFDVKSAKKSQRRDAIRAMGLTALVGVATAAYLRQSDEDENSLEHYGKKGMKWGVRNDDSGSGSSPSKGEQKKADKQAHKDWKKDVSGTEKANAIFQKAAKDFEKTVEIVNNDANYKGKDLTAPENRSLARDYDRTISTLFNEQLAQTSIDMTITDKGRAWIYQLDRNTGYLRGSEYQAVLEQSEGKPFPDFKVKLDAKGFVVGVTMEGELKHYGKKGMRWGVTTKSDGSVSVNQTRVRKSMRSTDKAVTVSQRKAGTYVKAKGGQRQTASTDAVKTQAARQKAKKSTTDSLSTKELKDSIERMRLEQEFTKLDKKVSRKGQSFVTSFLEGFGEINVNA